MKNLIIIPFVLIAVLTNAQDKAEKILNEVSSKTKDYKTIQAKFKSNMENKQSGINESQSGKISIKGEKYKVNMGGQIIYSNGSKVWTYIKDENTCYVSYVSDENDESISPSQIFTIWESGYKYQYQEEKTVNGQKADVIRMFPKDAKESKFHTVILSVNQDYTLNTIKIKGKDGTVMKYTVKEMDVNTPMEDSNFIFLKSKHPGVEIIEN